MYIPQRLNIKKQDCKACGLRVDCCLCQHTPDIKAQTHIHFLIHPKEYTRKTNTGHLAAKALGSECHEWQRLHPIPETYKESDFLLYHTPQMACDKNTPNPAYLDETQIDPQSSVLILDGTWQETQKMFNQTPALHTIPRLIIRQSRSKFTLRRNSKGLCTVEAVIYLLKAMQLFTEADQLDEYFARFVKHFQASQSGHKVYPLKASVDRLSFITNSISN